HRAGDRRGEFVAVNVGGLDDHVFSDTLFGHRKGAFTGADATRDGLIRLAADGTLFLEEIGEMAPESQARLLRVLDRGEFLPLGSDRTEYSRARIICATNRDLETAVEEGRFRRDLYFRIATYKVRIPALRERTEDIRLILEHLVRTEAERIGRSALPIPPDTLRAIGSRPLRGNVRELQQLVLHALLHQDWDEIPTSRTTASADTHITIERRDGDGPGVIDSNAPDADKEAPDRIAIAHSAADGVTFGERLPTPDALVAELLREADHRHPESRREAAAAIGLSPQAFANRWRRLEPEESVG
ncbi:MAG: sigma 54-interacting transcriptional regulator, partial [Opitutales bacterium]|nr:sigma 54-interacting transcriptional regulator [Opitutales bacterium]